MKQTTASIISNKEIALDVWELIIRLPFTPSINPGQFAMLSVGTRDGLILKRPLSIHDFNGTEVSFLYTPKGKGTRELTSFTDGEIEVILPLGKGFPLLDKYTKVALLGGGIGVFPLYSIIKAYPEATYYSYLGFRCKDNVCTQDKFKGYSEHTVISTDDGSFGKSGFITDLFFRDMAALQPDVIFACGPLPMFKALKEAKLDIPTYISMEERMACGFGACLTCACASKGGYVRTCKEGPVFNINEVEL